MKTYQTDPFDLDFTLLDYTQLSDEPATNHVVRDMLLAQMREEDPLIDGTEEPLH